MTYKAYWIGLTDLTIEQVTQAVALAMRNCRFIPKPVELRELVVGKAEDRTELAWMDVLKAIPLGGYKHIDFSDGIINATIRSLGGWPTFLARFTNATEEKWARVDFMRTYERLSSCGLSDEAMRYLTGMTDMQPEPVRIESSTPTQQSRIGVTVKRLGVRKGEPI